MTGVGIEPTTYGLKDSGASETADNAPSDSGALRSDSEAPNDGETHPKADAVCDTSCMGDTRPKRVPRWLTTDLVNWTREP